MNGELLSINSLLKGFFVDDDLVSVNEMLFEFVWENSFKRTDLISISYFLNDFSNLVIDMSGFDQSQSSLSCLISSQDDISLLSGNWGILVWLNNNSVSNEWCKTVNVNTKFEFNKISFLDGGGVFLKRWIVAADFVDWDSGGEGKSFENWLFVIDLGKFFVDKTVRP